jgi:hypothetical protein
MYSLFQKKPKNTTWNKGKLVGQKVPLKLKEIWAIRIHLQIAAKHRELALFNLAIDSKLRASDLLKLKVSDVSQGNQVASRAMVMQQKTGQPVQFEITGQTREAVSERLPAASMNAAKVIRACSLCSSVALRIETGDSTISSSIFLVSVSRISIRTHGAANQKWNVRYWPIADPEPWNLALH